MKVFYTPKQAADSGSFSPSAAKPPLVVAAWQAAVNIEIMPVPALTEDDLAMAHQRKYVRNVLKGKRSNGFGNCSPEIARSLPYTSGSMYAAARHAAVTGESCASPTSGFHHAGWDHGGGFCTFNGLMVAACMLKAEGLVNKVAIIDFDQHYGNGTDGIIRDRKINWINHLTFGNLAIRTRKSEAFALRRPALEFLHSLAPTVSRGWVEDDMGEVLPNDEDMDQLDDTLFAEDDDTPANLDNWSGWGGWEDRGISVDRWLRELPRAIAELVAGCDLVIYQAGADPHIDDPLGGSLTTEDMRRRDRIVFDTCRTMGVPVAWNLAGGYQTPIEKVIALHVNTAREFVAAFE